MNLEHLKDLDKKSLYKELMKRPGVYVGSTRLDYLMHFVNGFTMWQYLNAKNNDDYDLSNYEMQRWLLLDQSIIIRHAISINGWTLFFRCFGSRNVAFSNFARYLHADIPKPDDEYGYWNRKGYENAKHYRVTETSEQVEIDSKDLPKIPSNVSFDICDLYRVLEEGDKSEYCFIIITLIKEMLNEECNTYDLIRIYIKREDAFCQIRFIYHTPNGWKDDVKILADPVNYERLIKLHAYVECIEDIELHGLVKHGDFYCTFNDKQNYDDLSDISHTITDDISYYTQFEKWKIDMTGSY